MLQTTITIPVYESNIAVCIKSDNETLIKMIGLNWAKNRVPISRYLEIVFIDDYEEYSVSCIGTDCWCCRGVNNYSKVKVAIRGVLSEARIYNTIFVHGCSFEISLEDKKYGFLLSGASGAGKTTLTSLVAAKYPFSIINDDWGAVDNQRITAISTEEEYYHMKVASVKTLQPDISEDSMFMKENYHDGIRGLIAPQKVYSNRISRASICSWIVLIKDKSTLHYIKKMNAKDAVKIIAEGSYSPFYNGIEKFMNGSLILDTDEQLRYHYNSIKMVMDKVRVYIINNTGTTNDLLNDFEQIIGDRIE